ncbi:TolC family outer membrane protein [Inhella proteolytica]|uniref:TolC family outer membrane protein n=1 Tax=Inhella proteolytica TaxID=2795029 RepID=A0A931J1V6_9BURK|nr:TolC family outer membrane protein [Inhella proteolytica]MBH9578019.1 TolC family outer membrane protein [Inhella proteolytica]
MKRLLRSAMAVAAWLALSPAAQAMSFGEAFTAARQNDAQYRAAGHELEANRLAVPVARAALMPNVSINASQQEVDGWRKSRNANNQDMRLRLEYTSPQASVGMRMPIINRELGLRVEQAGAQAEYAEYQYQLRGNDLVDRLANAYLTVLLVEQTKLHVDKLVEALAQQVAQAQQRLARGEGTRVEVARGQAELDLAKVRVLETDDQLQLARRQLQRLTGQPLTQALQMPAAVEPPPLEPQGLFAWLELANRQNPALKAREQSLEVAKLGVKRNRAAHLPRLDLVASYSQNENESVSNLGQSTTQRAIGVQLNIPIYSGGGVEASVRQAVADRSRAEEEIRQERENVEIEVQRQYQLTQNGVGRIKAQERAVASAELAVTGMRRALEGGAGTTGDLADALSRSYAAQRELAQARIDYLLARTRLMLSAGFGMSEVAQELDRLLALAPAASTTAEK